MTIDVVEQESPIVVESAEVTTTTATEAEMPAGLAKLLDEQAIARLAARARQQAAEGGLIRKCK